MVYMRLASLHIIMDFNLDMLFCVICCLILANIQGNLISIGPGVYPSNHTVEHRSRAILVLGSCEFMHNGQVTSLNFFVATSDWLTVQIWRPIPDLAGRLELVHSQLICPNMTGTVMQVWFEDEPVRVQKGDKVGFTKLNDTFPIPYVNNSQMTADLWQYTLEDDEPPPTPGDIVSFDELSHPYHFSVTVTFKADRPNIFGQLRNASLENSTSVFATRPSLTTSKKEMGKDKMYNDKTENENIKYVYDGLDNALRPDSANNLRDKQTYIVHDIGEHEHPFDNDNKPTKSSTTPSLATISKTAADSVFESGQSATVASSAQTMLWLVTGGAAGERPLADRGHTTHQTPHETIHIDASHNDMVSSEEIKDFTEGLVSSLDMSTRADLNTQENHKESQGNTQYLFENSNASQKKHIDSDKYTSQRYTDSDRHNEIEH